MKELVKAVCVYHSIDLDGWMSAASVQYWFDSNRSSYPKGINVEINYMDFMGYNHGDDIPDLSVYEIVIMCDVSFPKENMLKLRSDLGENFIWIDHHKSAIEELIPKDHKEPVFNGIQKTNNAACLNTWFYFMPDKNVPLLLQYLGEWDNSINYPIEEDEEKINMIQYGARAKITDYKSAYSWLLASIKKQAVYGIDLKAVLPVEDYLYSTGCIIYEHLAMEAKQVYDRGFDVSFYEELGTDEGDNSIGFGLKEHKFICFNKERFNPINFGIDYHKDGYDGAACFWYDNGKWAFSLYNDNKKVDCSKIAKQYGGGGHSGAAGFRLIDIQSLDFLIKNK